jgi:antirestriction protein ArdC
MTTTTKTRTKKRRTYDGPSAEEKLCSALIEVLERGVNPWRREWAQLGLQGQHRNLLTGAAYRGSNPAVLEMWAACRGYNLPLWLGCAQAKGKGWYPRKGSQGCYVLRPQLNKRAQEDENGKPVLGPDGQPLIAAWVSYKPTWWAVMRRPSTVLMLRSPRPPVPSSSGLNLSAWQMLNRS